MFSLLLPIHCLIHNAINHKTNFQPNKSSVLVLFWFCTHPHHNSGLFFLPDTHTWSLREGCLCISRHFGTEFCFHIHWCLKEKIGKFKCVFVWIKGNINSVTNSSSHKIRTISLINVSFTKRIIAYVCHESNLTIVYTKILTNGDFFTVWTPYTISVVIYLSVINSPCWHLFPVYPFSHLQLKSTTLLLLSMMSLQIPFWLHVLLFVHQEESGAIRT